VLRVGVSTQGLPANAVVATSSGHSALDQAALAAMQRWHSTRRRKAQCSWPAPSKCRSSSAWKTD
jgi:TonB family protein